MIDLYIAYRLIRSMVKPYTEWDAYKHGIIDDEGNILKKSKELATRAEKAAWSKLDLMILRIRKLLEKTPIGKSRLATYAAALWLIRECKEDQHKMINESYDIDEESFKNFVEEVIANTTANIAVVDKPLKKKKKEEECEDI